MLVLALGIPVIAVVAWFLFRLFNGRYIGDLDEPDPVVGLPAASGAPLEPVTGRTGADEGPVRDDDLSA